MCLILVGNKDRLAKLALHKAWQVNSHGAGIIFLGEGKPCVIKGIMQYKGLHSLLKRADDGQTIALHFRQATHGKVCQEFTHPFNAGQGCLLMHNGVLSHLGNSGATGTSDSAHLASILTRLPFDDKLALLRSLAGYNRFLLVRGSEFWPIGSWEEQDGIYHSNSLLVRKVYKYTYPAKQAWNDTPSEEMVHGPYGKVWKKSEFFEN